MQPFQVELPEKASTNVLYRRHHRARYKTEQDFYLAVRHAVQKQGIVPVKKYPVSIENIFEIPGKRLDSLNLSGMAKMVEDGLRHAKILKDDSPKYVKSTNLSSVPTNGKGSVAWVLITEVDT